MTPKEEVEKILEAGLPFAQQMLEAHREFPPFGAVIDPDGELRMVAGYDGDDSPPIGMLIEMITDGFVAGATKKQFRATGLFVNVSITPDGDEEPVDAVQVGLDHEAGYAVNVFLPYVVQDDGSVDYGELIATHRDANVFGVSDA